MRNPVPVYRRSKQAGGAYPAPREAEQYVIVYETYAFFDGMDELSQDELTTILYD